MRDYWERAVANGDEQWREDVQRVADRSLAEDRMQLMLHQRQNKRREQQEDAERLKQLLGLWGNHALQDYQTQLILLEQQKKRKLMEDAHRNLAEYRRKRQKDAERTKQLLGHRGNHALQDY